ncbi:RraA family protein [Sinomonas susongensis]|uniref:RraA family protein n=1 Tax=Sinomonas susongensis TaxID=1324851 RepID=UPI001109FDFC|nr:RraA family protein [Sinomonas susongensis]
MRIQPSREDLLAMTAEWTGERFEDGRPRVPDEVLEELRLATTEHVWSVLWAEGYERQFEGQWRETHPGTPLVGRAVTAQFLPMRPDYDGIVVATANREGRPTRSNNQNWMVVESLVENDVMVVDIFGKVYEGTVVGDNLGTAVASRTGAGAVIHGGIRDLQGIRRLENVNIFHRGVDPTPIRNVTLGGMNIPVRIGGATVLPGDVVLGTPTGVIFIPPQLAAKAAAASADTRNRDRFGKLRLAERRYTSSQIDVATWEDGVEADYQAWLAAEDGRVSQPTP